MTPSYAELTAGLSDEELGVLLLGMRGVQNTRNFEAKIRKSEHTEMEFKLQVLSNQKAIMLLLLQLKCAPLAEALMKE